MANLFRENIVDAKFVIFKNCLFHFLPFISTRTQIKNFEKYMERSIADLLLIDVLPAIESENPESFYYKFRTLLHHLLNGPHKERLLEIDIPVFRRLLAKEVCESDAKFLTEGLADPIVNVEEIIQQVPENL